MAAEDVAQALMTMDDPEVRSRVADGDFGALSTLDLTAQEQAMVRDATLVLPDGHPSKELVPFEPGEVEAHSLRPGENAGYWPKGTARAIDYVQREASDPEVQAHFLAWQKPLADRFP